jgi:hypothetical protein
VRLKLTPRAIFSLSLSLFQSKQEDFTAGGGGARGYCDVEEIKNAIKECEGTRFGKKEEDDSISFCFSNPSHHILCVASLFLTPLFFCDVTFLARFFFFFFFSVYSHARREQNAR